MQETQGKAKSLTGLVKAALALEMKRTHNTTRVYFVANQGITLLTEIDNMSQLGLCQEMQTWKTSANTHNCHDINDIEDVAKSILD